MELRRWEGGMGRFGWGGRAWRAEQRARWRKEDLRGGALFVGLLVIVLALHAANAGAGGATSQGQAAGDAIELQVLEAGTGRPIERFVAVAGTPYSDPSTGGKVPFWQWHTVREGEGGKLLWPLARTYEDTALRIEAEGHRPFITEWVRKDEGPRRLDVELAPDPGIQGLLLLPDGTPAKGGAVAVCIQNRNVRLEGASFVEPKASSPPTLRERTERCSLIRAGEGGAFRVATETEDGARIVAVAPEGFVDAPFAEFREAPTLRLRSWGRLEGRVAWGEEPGKGEEVELSIFPQGLVGASQSATTRTDDEGRFAFEGVAPTLAQLSRTVPVEGDPDGERGIGYSWPYLHVEVQAGEPTRVVLGGRGRLLRGKLTGRDSWEGFTIHYHPTAPPIGFPGDDAQWKGFSALLASPVGKLCHGDALPVGKDGAFEVGPVLPGRYQLFVGAAGLGGWAASLAPRVPEETWESLAPGAPAPAPLDLGEVPIPAGRPKEAGGEKKDG